MHRFTLTLTLLCACTASHDAPVEGAAQAPLVSVESDGDDEIHATEVSPAQAPAQPAEARPGADSTGMLLPSVWASPACDGRSYERQISFEEGRFRATDLVSPCPPGVTCVWSGIIHRRGSWTLDGQQLRLIPDADDAAAAQASRFPLPAQLWLSTVGTLSEDDGACPYVMAPSG